MFYASWQICHTQHSVLHRMTTKTSILHVITWSRHMQVVYHTYTICLNVLKQMSGSRSKLGRLEVWFGLGQCVSRPRALLSVCVRPSIRWREPRNHWYEKPMNQNRTTKWPGDRKNMQNLIHAYNFGLRESSCEEHFEDNWNNVTMKPLSDNRSMSNILHGNQMKKWGGRG